MSTESFPTPKATLYCSRPQRIPFEEFTDALPLYVNTEDDGDMLLQEVLCTVDQIYIEKVIKSICK